MLFSLRTLTTSLAGFAIAVTAAIAHAENTPAQDRAAILRATEKAVSADLANKPVSLSGAEVRLVHPFISSSVGSRYAFVLGSPKKPNGSAFDYSGTQYADDIANGDFEEGHYVVLHETASGWKSIDMASNCTDVCWLGFMEKYPSVASLFSMNSDLTRAAADSFERQVRTDILNAARPSVSAGLQGRPIKFVVDSLTTSLGPVSQWAFLASTPVNPDGSRINPRGTVFEDADHNAFVLLEKNDERWEVRETLMGCTDVCWLGLEERYPAAQGALFPPTLL